MSAYGHKRTLADDTFLMVPLHVKLEKHCTGGGGWRCRDGATRREGHPEPKCPDRGAAKLINSSQIRSRSCRTLSFVVLEAAIYV
jgi:hypothetical protein